MCADDISLLCCKDPILPAFRRLRPVSRVLPVQQHYIEVFGLRGAPQFVKFCLGVNALMERSHLGHQLIAIAWQAFQCLAQHCWRLVSLGRLEEADAVRSEEHTSELQ